MTPTTLIQTYITALQNGTVGEDLTLIIKANFAMFFELKNGKIWRQRNYDCFEAF